ncbi:HpcH/HpaI aldolase/citrate lyase family protein [Halogranum amylolyticum]|uniref:HpcH/HpaI aldolase/citrate lyase family protein n=1 Tax=Halogranum amylolyticum TaxID=660520 RepID=A0A1H8V6P2_9EURY|nr:aldolase/citrate lyase family protein [Halogranum amylolyticum]SEP10894.1 HpcH/HpaI aldolase/citrate lyase family protein [Halogranum amylolyticum]
MGGRGVDRSGRWARYVDSLIAGEDTEILVGTMVENERAVANIEDILAVPSLGFASVGPADLAMSMSESDPLAKHPEAVQSPIDRTLDACLTADVLIDRIRSSVEETRTAPDAGYQIVRTGGDVESTRTVLGDRLDELDPT